jgi:hypothetical protein
MIIPIAITNKDIRVESEIEEITFKTLGLTEANIEEFFRKNIGLIFDDEDENETLLIVGQQVINSSNARNDLIALDGKGNLVLIEIKRDAADMASRSEAMEFQAIRYAASLATISNVDELVDKIFARYIKRWNTEFVLSDLTPEEFGRRRVNKFLKDNNADRSFNRRQRLILVASSFDEQTLSAAAWLNKGGVDISCVCLTPIRSIGVAKGPIYLSVERLIPPRPIEEFYVDFPDPAIGPASPTGPTTRRARTLLPRMPKLMEWGIVAPGNKLVIKGYPDSQAEVVDSKDVRFKGETMSYNEWGQKVTGWSAICIYDWAETPTGKTLSEYRAERMEKEGAAAAAG